MSESRAPSKVSIRKRETGEPAQHFAPWLVRAERLLIEAVRTVRVLGAVVPRNAAPERARLMTAFEAGDVVMPRWSYARTDHGALRKALERAAQRLLAEPHPIAQLY